VYNPDRFLKDRKIDLTVWDPKVASWVWKENLPWEVPSQEFPVLVLCHILIVYNTRPALGNDGKELGILPEMTNGMLS